MKLPLRSRQSTRKLLIFIRLQDFDHQNALFKFFKTRITVERHQCVQFGGQRSYLLLVTHLVSQGSILQPILFDIYLVDMSLKIPGESLQYSDVTKIYYHMKLLTVT